MLMMMKAHEVPIYTMDYDSARRLMESKHNDRTKVEDVGSSEDYLVDAEHGSFKVRVYQPAVSKNKKRCYVYYHGGGAVLFSIKEYDSVCRHLCNTSGSTVVSVDYRLAPEFKYPVQVNDAIDAYQWVLKNHALLDIDPRKAIVMGDSFGGYLATEVCLESMKRGYTCPLAQILLYPRTDYGRVDLES